MEMEVHRRTVSDSIFLCEKFFELRLFCGRNKKNRRTALKSLSAGSEMSKTALYHSRHSGTGNDLAKLAVLKTKEASAYLSSYDTAS